MTKKEKALIRKAITLFMSSEDGAWEIAMDTLSAMIGGPTYCDKPSKSMSVIKIMQDFYGKPRGLHGNKN